MKFVSEMWHPNSKYVILAYYIPEVITLWKLKAQNLQEIIPV